MISQAIKRHARIGKPIIITETGIADGIDTRRELWATTYLKAVSATAPYRIAAAKHFLLASHGIRPLSHGITLGKPSSVFACRTELAQRRQAL